MASAWGSDFQPSNQHLPDTSFASSNLSTAPPVSRPPPPEEEPLPNRSRIPSLSSATGRPRGLSTVSSTSSVRRKPLPTTASPLATRFSSPVQRRESVVSAVGLGSATPLSIGSPTLLEHPLPATGQWFEGSTAEPEKEQRAYRTSSSPSGSTPSIERTSTDETETPRASASLAKTSPAKTPDSTVQSHHVRLASDSVESTTSDSTDPGSVYSQTHEPKQTSTLSMFTTKPTPPHLILTNNATSRDLPNETNASANLNKQLPKSPGLKLGTFFGWGGVSSPASSITTFSDEKGVSPSRSPTTPHSSFTKSSTTSQRNLLGGTDVPKANSKYESYFGDVYNKQLPPITPATTLQVEEMEAELKTITAELATSIHREMELEDLVERLQSEASFAQGHGKRTSDYFSDSGTSSVKYGGESDARTDELDRLQRKAEREKAQVRLELGEKVQEERSRRKALESQIRNLEQKASQVDLASINSIDASGRLRELEATCEDLRRRLAEERQVKDNFEDLLTALKSELENSHNERDNLRDEIVPQLRARVEGLEAQAAEHEKLTYENTKMQQQMQALKDENNTLAEARRIEKEMHQQMSKFNSINEESSTDSPRAAAGLTRSNSIAHTSAYQRSTRPPSRPASRPASMIKVAESREVLAERVKDVEAQRDALHSALKSLLERQEHRDRENKKRIRQLEQERDRALHNSPRRQGYNQEVASLREEINSLRRRADEAIEQKWLCEKGLSGIKMDLERAEQEIGSLRSLLQDHDISIPYDLRQSNRERGRSGSSTSDSLERAYRDLQKAHSESLNRIRNLEVSNAEDAETKEAIAQLERSLAAAVTERDFARKEAEAYRQSAQSLQSHEREHVTAEVALADELRASAKRVEELATQVRQQLASNATLRQRLAETIDRGEKEQKTNASRIVHMQGKLRSLEDALMVAQQASEERVSKHEEQIRELKESHNKQLLRVKDGLRSPRTFSLKQPLSPVFPGARSPRLDSTSSGKGLGISEESKTDYLKQKVMELEKALEEADQEMQEVVSKMNIAQIEVMELQNEREEAVRQTKRLQAKIEEESLRGFEKRFATLSS